MGEAPRIGRVSLAVFLARCDVAKTILIHEPTSLLFGLRISIDTWQFLPLRVCYEQHRHTSQLANATTLHTTLLVYWRQS
jgi:hypothetical protein